MRSVGISGIPSYMSSGRSYLSGSRSYGTARSYAKSAVKNNSGLGGSGSINKDSNNKINSVLESLNKSSAGIREHTKKLDNTEAGSLFEKAVESKSTKDIVSEVEGFVSDYNSMITNMKKAGDSVNSVYQKQYAQDVTQHKEALKAIGITANKDGTLAIDKKVLEGAPLDDLKKVFTGSSSFAAETAVKSIYTEANAVSLISQNNERSKSSLYQMLNNNYNNYGSYGSNDILGLLGGSYNSFS